MLGFVFDIKRYAVNDGPGIRTTVFLKGCPLRCQWCHNPESQSAEQETMTVRRKLGENVFDDVQQVGYTIDSTALVEKIARDQVFYDESQGGVTFSGGEPLMQADFLLECLQKCREQNIQTCVDTAGAVDTPLLADIIKLTDIFLFDVKTANELKFKQHIGGGFQLVMNNLTVMAQQARRTIIRIPVIPGFNDDPESIDSIIAEISRYPRIKEVSLLPFHRTGADKYRRLRRQWNMGSVRNLSQDDLAPIYTRFTNVGYTIFRT